MNVKSILLCVLGFIGCGELMVSGAVEPRYSCLISREEVERRARELYSICEAYKRDAAGRKEWPQHMPSRGAQYSEEQEEMRGGRYKMLTVSDLIILYNANVPINSMKLIERSGAVRVAKPRSPTLNLLDQSIWEILTRKGSGPFTLIIEANNRIYKWEINSGYGSEYGLIQKRVRRGFEVELRQMDEFIWRKVNPTYLELY